MDNKEFYTVSLTEYNEYWQVVNRGQGDLDDRVDIYKLSFDGLLVYEYSEHDK